MKKTVPILWGAAIVLLFTVAGLLYDAWTAEDSAQQSSNTLSKTSMTAYAAPDFTLSDLSGNPVTLSDLRGKVVVLNFWASWCGPCQSEMDDFEAFYQSLDSDNVALLMVNLTTGRETEASARTFIEKKGYTFPVVLDTQAAAGTAYQITGIPTTYILDRDGNIYNIHMGITTKEELETDVGELLS